MAPFVNRAEFQIIGLDDEDFLQMMNDDGDMKEDLGLPLYPDGLGNDLKAGIEAAEEAGQTVIVSVVSAMGKEQVTSFKTVESA